MVESLNSLSIFLASPGDLGEERKAIKSLEREINLGLGKHLGCRVEVLGWEDTLPGLGRPQELINRDVDRCDLFIGVLNRRWGMNPGGKQSPYTSGFEEEFTRALARHKEQGTPEISIYFKKVEDVEDPGEQLQKVLNFKNKLVETKDVYFRDFEDLRSLEAEVRAKITEVLFQVQDGSSGERGRTKSTKLNQSQEPMAEHFTPEGVGFIKSLLDTSDEEINEYSIARLRLLCIVAARPENDQLSLDVHDANIMYRKNVEDLSDSELLCLAKAAFSEYESEIIPPWKWVAELNKRFEYAALERLSVSEEKAACGVIKAMALVKHEISPQLRQFLIETLLGTKETPPKSESRAIEALRYFGKLGTKSDFAHISILSYKSEELRAAALEAKLKISMRHNDTKEVGILVGEMLENGILIQDSDLISRTFDYYDSHFTEDLLRLGISHKSVQTRECSFYALASLRPFSEDELELLNKDSSPTLKRKIAFRLLEKQEISLQEAKQMFKVVSTGGLLSLAAFSFNKYSMEPQLYYYSLKSVDELENLVRSKAGFLNKELRLALYKKNFRKYGDLLRNLVDEDFASFYKASSSLDLDDPTTQETLELASKLSLPHLRQHSVEILCEKGNKKDYDRVYRSLTTFDLELTQGILLFLKKHMNIQDCKYLCTKPIADKENQMLSASIIYMLERKNLDQLFRTEFGNESILTALIKQIPTSKFGTLELDTITTLLNHPTPAVRKAAALKSVESLAKSKIAVLLSQYIAQGAYFYNVVTWLDFGLYNNAHTARSAVTVLNS